MKRQLLAACCLVALGLSAQQTITLNPEKDNTLFSEGDDLSNGSGQYLFSGQTAANATRRALLKFDVAGNLPGDAQILSVRLTLQMNKTISGAQSMGLHLVMIDWGEGSSNASGNEGTGTAASQDDATWSHRFFPNQTWNVPGGDFLLTASASQTVSGIGSYTWSSASMITDVQNWLDNPLSNSGWILVGNENSTGTAKRFASRETATAASRPQLEITYETSSGVVETVGEPLLVEWNPLSMALNVVNQSGVNAKVRLFDMRGNMMEKQTIEAGFDDAIVLPSLPSGVYVVTVQGTGILRSQRIFIP